MRDGVALMYVKDDVVYPVVLSQGQHDILTMTAKSFEPLQVIDHPLGNAVDLMKEDSQ